MSTENFRGWVDSLDCNEIAGWAANIAHSESPTYVSIYLNGQHIGIAVCDEIRSDAVAAGIPGARQFRFDMKGKVTAGGRVQVGFEHHPLQLPQGDKWIAAQSQSSVPVNKQIVHVNRPGIYVYDEDDFRILKFSSSTPTRQTCISLNNPALLMLEYTRLIMASFYLNPQPASVLIIGLGGGVLPAAFWSIAPHATIDMVEIDEDVIQVALEYFGLVMRNDSAVHQMDGRMFVEKALANGKKYDLVVLDAFIDGDVPVHLKTLEFLQEVRQILSDDGVFVANTSCGSVDYHKESATYYQVFGRYLYIKKAMRVILAAKNNNFTMAGVRHQASMLVQALQQVGVSNDVLLSALQEFNQSENLDDILLDPA